MALETLQEQIAREELEALYQAGEDWPLAVLDLVRDRPWLEDLQDMWHDLCDIFPDAHGEGPAHMVARIALLAKKAGP